jgi:prepilin-type N-terminal cleavage/methylation domain-containing protein
MSRIEVQVGRRRRSAFTLIELLVVIAIIVPSATSLALVHPRGSFGRPSACMGWLAVVAALGVFLGRAGQATGPPTYSFIRSDVPGSAGTTASGINDSGQIVGYYYDGTIQYGFLHGFLLDQASYTTLDVPGSMYTQAFGRYASG